MPKSLQSVTGRNRKIALFLYIILIFSPGITLAEPTKAIHSLMTEPATLFDLGIVRLENLLKKTQTGALDVSYDFQSNKIQISVIVTNRMSTQEKKSSKDKFLREIGHIIQTIRLDLGVNPSTGEVDAGNTAFEDCFRHAGRNKNAGPANLREELYNMTEISVKVKVQRGKVAMEGQAPLVGKDIVYDK
jgi:hypothetical protein